MPYVEIPERLTPGIPLRFRHRAAARRLCARRDRDFDGGPPDQDQRQSAPSGEPRRDRCVRRSGAALALRSRSIQGGAQRQRHRWPGVRSRHLCCSQMQQEHARAGRRPARSSPNRMTSPTLIRQIDALRKSLPQAKWYRYEPIDDDARACRRHAGLRPSADRPPALGRCPRCADARRRSDRLRSRADPLRARPGRGAAITARATISCGSMRPSRPGR